MIKVKSTSRISDRSLKNSDYRAPSEKDPSRLNKYLTKKTKSLTDLSFEFSEPHKDNKIQNPFRPSLKEDEGDLE